MAANMDTVGRFEMASVLNKHHLFTCIHKHYSVDQVCGFWLGVTWRLAHADPMCLGTVEGLRCGVT